MKFGSYEISAIETGEFSLDGGAMFGTVPRVLWEKKNPPDSKHRIRMAMRALLLVGEGRTILVDCGVGDKGGARFKELFDVDQTKKNMSSSLAAKGLSVGDITDVILTHLHFDHAGGATTRKSDGTYEPTFPNATYHLQSRNLKVAESPNARERASYLKENFEALVSEKRLRLLEKGAELFPGVELFVSEGHTEAQQHLLLDDGKKMLFYGGDLIPTSSHLPLPWVMGYDLHPLTMLEEKERILSRSKNREFILFYEHDLYKAAEHIISSERGYVAEATIAL